MGKRERVTERGREFKDGKERGWKRRGRERKGMERRVESVDGKEGEG